jgi:hypothetical protein
MSELFTTRIDAYAGPQQAAIASRAGLDSALAVAESGFAAAGAVAGAGIVTVAVALQRLNRHVEEVASQATASVALPHAAASAPVARVHRELAASRATFEAIDKLDLGLLQAATHVEGGARLDELRSQLGGLRARAELTSRGGTVPVAGLLDHAMTVRHELNGLVEAAASRLVRAEGAVVSDAVRATLIDMGYRVREPRCRLRNGVVVKGESARGTAIYVSMEPRRGRIQADLSGFRGAACEVERARFLDGLARRGIRVQLMDRHQHGRPEGGVLGQATEPLFGADEYSDRERRQRALAWQRRHLRQGD